MPYAAFGWLPAGFSTAAGAAMASASQDQVTTLTATLVAGDRATGRLVTLTVSAAGACRITGPQRDRVLVAETPLPNFRTVTYPRGLSCNDGVGHRTVTPLTKAAPDVRGGSAFYLPSGGLAWEYAPDSWAQLTPTTESTGGRDRLLPAPTKPPRAGRTAPPSRIFPRRSSPPPPVRCSGRSPVG